MHPLLDSGVCLTGNQTRNLCLCQGGALASWATLPGRVPFSTSAPALPVGWLTDESHPDRYEVISHCGFHLHFSDNDIAHFFIGLLAICLSSLEKYLSRSFAHVLIGLFGLFFCWGFFGVIELYEFYINFGYWAVIRYTWLYFCSNLPPID